MRGGLVGLLIGLIVGAGAMYLVLRPPWGGGDAPPDAAVIATAPADAGVAKPKPKKGGKWRGRTGGGRQSPGSDFSDEGGNTDEPVAPTVKLSAADRALEWRGDNTAISRKIDMNSGADARSLEQGEINATISSQTGGTRQCVVNGANGTDMRATTITVKMVVEGNGKVSRSQLQAPRYLFEKGLLACAQSSFRGMSFPATGAPTLVTFPINLD